MADKLFPAFRNELDEHYDRRERIVKTSRDITALSKKAIFSLQRVATKDKASSLKEADEKLIEVRKLFAKVEPDLRGEAFWRYERQISPGIQEYLEAFLFASYIRDRKLATLSECQDSLLMPVEDEGTSTPQYYALVTPSDYLLGVGDLTGELMRLAIGGVGKYLARSKVPGTEADDVPNIREILAVVRQIQGETQVLSTHVRGLPDKLKTLNTSLRKIESALYAVEIRSAEYADAPEMLAELARTIANASSAGGGGDDDS